MGSMAEILSMIKSQGINVEGFEAEAEDIWESLDEMSKKNPEEYRDFIRSQYESSLTSEGEENGEAESTASNMPTESDRFFRPIAGFSIKSKTSGGDGIKVRFAGDGKIIFINFCSHPAIEAPLDRNGHHIEARYLCQKISADGLKLRDVDDATVAVDVILNKSVIDSCLSSKDDCRTSTFKQQIIDLASDWIGTDTGVVFRRLWTPCADNYSGGRGKDKRTPVLFPVSHATSQGNSKRDDKSNDFLGSSIGEGGPGHSGASSSDTKGAVIQSPSSFLKALHSNAQNLESHSEVSISNSRGADSRVSPRGTPPTAARLVIEVESSDSQVQESSTSGTTSMKKGFLSNVKKPLYGDESAREGSGAGGSLARVMDKCTVIDMTQSSPNPLCSSSSSDSSSSSSSGSSSTNSNLHSATDGSPPGCDVMTLSQMVIGAGAGAGAGAGSGAGTGAGASVRSHHTVSSDVSELDQERGNNLVLVNSLGHSTTCSYKTSLIEDRLCVCVCVTGMSSDIFNLDSLDLQVSSEEVRITYSLCQHLAEVTGPRSLLTLSGFKCPKLNKNAVEAKLSRKKKTLSITVQYL